MTLEEQLKIDPVTDRGRWYSVFVENDAGAYKITFADAPIKSATLTDTTIALPDNFIADDVKARVIGSTDTSGNVSVTYKGTHTEIGLPGGIDHAHIYIHGFTL